MVLRINVGHSEQHGGVGDFLSLSECPVSLLFINREEEKSLKYSDMYS